MSVKSAPKTWHDLFCRVADRDDGMPRFSLIGAKGYIYDYDGYLGGHEGLDRIIKLTEQNGIKCHVSGFVTDSQAGKIFEDLQKDSGFYPKDDR
jgi:hypothetical protein